MKRSFLLMCLCRKHTELRPNFTVKGKYTTLMNLKSIEGHFNSPVYAGE
jgi:hypothetical protein